MTVVAGTATGVCHIGLYFVGKLWKCPTCLHLVCLEEKDLLPLIHEYKSCLLPWLSGFNFW